MDTASQALLNNCARCGQAFTCRASDIAECHCNKIPLDKNTLQKIREEFSACLCKACLEFMSPRSSNAINTIVLLIAFLFPGLVSFSQNFPPAAGQPGSSAMHRDSSAFRDWANSCSVKRGFQDISNTSLGFANAGDSTLGTGKSLTNGAVSLGDGGIATCQFNAPVFNGAGYDFAVFENSFDGNFLELAFVEVSSDGLNFFRFPAQSLVDTVTQAGTFDNTDPRLINNLAGKYMAGYGTPFDLEDLKNNAGLNINAVTHIRVVDVVGSLNSLYCSRDASGRKINDPWPTPFPQGGFDLDAIGVINSASSLGTKNYERDEFYFPSVIQAGNAIGTKPEVFTGLFLFDVQGRLVARDIEGVLHTENVSPDLYILQAVGKEKSIRQKIIIY